MSYNEQLRCDYLTINHEDAIAWRMTPEWELYTTVVTTMGAEDKFYESGDNRVRRIADLVRKTSPEFVASLAVYTREQMHLRSVPLLLLVELARCHHGDSLVSRAVARTVQRVDEITELLMCYQWRTGRKNLAMLSSQLRKGLAEAFNKFDEYQFAKYNRKDRKVTLRDALVLVHPKPKDEAQSEIFRRILNDTLTTPYTWETELSQAGKGHFESEEERDEAMKETWQKLVASGRLGYMATLRNLRNMAQLCVDDRTKDSICDKLSNPYEISKSKQLPFRFLSAYLQLINDSDFNVQIPYPDLHRWVTQAFYKLSLKEWQIEEKLEKLRTRRFGIRHSKVCRYPLEQSLANTAIIKGELMFKQPKMHIRYWEKKAYIFDSLREKDLRLERRLEKMLENIRKRKTALVPFNKRIDEARARRDRIMQFLRAAHTRELKRYRQRLEKLGVSHNQHIRPFLDALEDAVRYSADNIPGFDADTRVLLASDTSGSMMQPVSRNSSVMCYHIGLLLSMLMKHRCKSAVTGMFGDFWKVYDMPSDNVLQNTVDMTKLEGEVGYGTNGYKVIEWLIKKRIEMDKVMLFTDCQLWDSNSWYGDHSLPEYWKQYKEMVAPNARLYIFDLAGYGQSPISMERDDVFCIAGWSDKVFDILAALERGKSAIDEIRRIAV